jgi:hypothetical protein
VVPFDDPEMLKARSGRAKRQTASTSKQFE